MDETEIDKVISAFAAAAQRAVRLGFDVVELHMAHGYLMQQFLSPISNTRTDAYGGNRVSRMRFPLRIARAVREAVPKSVGLGARLSGSDFIEGGWDLPDTIALSQKLADAGFDFVCLSGGGPAGGHPHVAPGYQVPFAKAVKEQVRIGTCAVGMIVDAEQANAIIAEGQADLVAMARAFLDDPRWPWHAAAKLGAELKLPPPYARVSPELWPGHPSRR